MRVLGEFTACDAVLLEARRLHIELLLFLGNACAQIRNLLLGRFECVCSTGNFGPLYHRARGHSKIIHCV